MILYQIEDTNTKYILMGDHLSTVRPLAVIDWVPQRALIHYPGVLGNQNTAGPRICGYRPYIGHVDKRIIKGLWIISIVMTALGLKDI